MPSTITITFSITDPGSNSNNGVLNLLFNDGVNSHNLQETLKDTTPLAYQFQRVPWQAGLESSLSFGQATNYALAFNRDYKNIGGTGNLNATTSGAVVTITAINGTFPNGSNYTGDMIGVAFGTPNNQTPVSVPVLSQAITANGNCSAIEYSLSAAGGTGPYKLYLGGVLVQSGWNGAAQNVALIRGALSKLHIVDNNNAISSDVKINVPKAIVASEFEVSVIAKIDSEDLTVNSNPIAGTTPLQYSLDASSASTGGNYQNSNLFPGVLVGTYKIFIKDKFGCEVSKVVTVAGTANPVTGQVPRYFVVSDFNSLSFARQDNNRKGYINTLSFQENVGIKKHPFFRFPSTSNIQTQFKSSYSYHNITLFKCDGTKEELAFQNTQSNIGAKEKVDCKLFQESANVIGVYFDGGNSYEPGTTTVLGASPHNAGLPEWGSQIGQYVALDGIGTKTITGIGFNTDLAKMYFKVSGSTALTDSKVEVTFNRHPYDVFRVDFPMSKISNRGFVRIEAGYSFDEIDQVWQSETIKVLSQEEIDSGKFIQLKWSGYKVLGDMLFIDGIECEMWIKGVIRPFAISEAKTYDGVEEIYSLSQTARMGQRVKIPLMSPKQWSKFNLASGITQGGTLIIEDMELVRTSDVKQDELEQTNYSNIECEFGFSGDGLTVQSSSLILNPSTGVVGGGGTGK